MKKILILSVLLICVSFCWAQKSAIHLKLKKGETYKQSTKAVSIVEQQVMGMDMEVKMIISGNMSYKVISVTEEGYEMEVSYNSLSLNMSMPQGTTAYDSEDETDEEPYAKALRAMKNKPFQVSLSKYGEVREVRNLDAMFDDVIRQFGDLPAADQEQIKTQLMNSYGEKSFKGSIEMLTSIYPRKKVAVGDEWGTAITLETGFSIDIKSSFTLEEIAADYYVIKGESEIETALKDELVEVNGMKMQYDLSGKMDANIKVDKNTGWIMDAVFIQQISGEAKIQDSAQMPGGITIPMKINNESTYSDQ